MKNKPQLLHSLGKASVPAVNQYLQLAKAQGINLDQILKTVELSETDLADNDAMISGLQFQQLIAQLVKYSKDPLFGLHTAQFVQPGSYNVLGYICMNCTTLGEALTKIQPFEKLVGDMGTTSIEPASLMNEKNAQIAESDNENAILKINWNCIFTDPLVRRHMIDNCLASWVTFARYLVGKNYDPIQVSLTRAKPDSKKESLEYQQLFNCPVFYSQPNNSIFFYQSMLELPLNKGNKQILSTLESLAEQQIKTRFQHQTIVDQVTQLIQKNLPTGRINQVYIANLMGMSAKTLQRKLKNESTNFQQLLDNTRREMAIYLLTNTPYIMTEISELLGFSEPRSFHRWFLKVIGETPGNYRKSSFVE
ncbi:MAG: AraC family transcriptional regulator [Kangiellaceae bacterium]|nr:AraC family transcriptional regulator [Kangiellaceae bacterium]MCW9000483.1 AraC family transcriptional regulator [Kangiellaceae bacterium]MCW9016708.1 AraC family transcriptional regulator [Kangiellaceae bacterium]